MRFFGGTFAGKPPTLRSYCAMSSHSLKILVVENHEDTLTYLSHYLSEYGHVTKSARNMTSALEILSDTPVDILICDIGLPDGDGWELMKRLGAMERPLPFGIAMTGYNAPGDMERSQRAGYQRHLVKPFLPAELDEIMRDAVLQVSPPPNTLLEKKTRTEAALPDTA